MKTVSIVNLFINPRGQVPRRRWRNQRAKADLYLVGGKGKESRLAEKLGKSAGNNLHASLSLLKTIFHCHCLLFHCCYNNVIRSSRRSIFNVEYITRTFGDIVARHVCCSIGLFDRCLSDATVASEPLVTPLRESSATSSRDMFVAVREDVNPKKLDISALR